MRVYVTARYTLAKHRQATSPSPEALTPTARALPPVADRRDPLGNALAIGVAVVPEYGPVMGSPLNLRHLGDLLGAVYVACGPGGGAEDARQRATTALQAAVQAYLKLAEDQGIDFREASKIFSDAVADAQRAAQGLTQP